jgi:proteasome alpha subunit
MDMGMDMQHQVMGYDRAATMFSPEGHLLQVEYAEKAVRLGSSSIGLKCKDGVVILADRRIKDKLVTPNSSTKINEVDSHIIASAAGIQSDIRVLIEKAQLISQQNRITYDSPIEPELIIKEIANIKQQFTQYGGVRPYGVSVMIAGINGETPELFSSDVTGNYFSYLANVIGENDDKIKELLRQEFNKESTVEEGLNIGLKIFKKVYDKDFDIEKFEAALIKTKNVKLERIKGEELKKFIK